MYICNKYIYMYVCNKYIYISIYIIYYDPTGVLCLHELTKIIIIKKSSSFEYNFLV